MSQDIPLDSKDIKKYIRVIDSSTNDDWRTAVENFNRNIRLNDGESSFSESNCIVKYIHDKKNFEIFNFDNKDQPDFFQPAPLISSSREPVTEENILQYAVPLFREYLKQIANMTGGPIDTDYFFLVRLIRNSGTAGTDLQAEGWHHDYMWAPSEFSSIIYTETENMRLKAADFCIYGFDKTRKKDTTRPGFGTDSWGPGIGSFFTRAEIYDQYEKFLTKLKESHMIDPNYRSGYYIAIKISRNEIARAKILDFVDNKIYFQLEPYGQLPAYMQNTDLVPESEQWWDISKLNKKLDAGVENIVKDHKGFSVKFADWNISWKIPLLDINPGGLDFNLLRGRDKTTQDMDTMSETVKNKLIYKYFSKPLYDEYLKKGGSASGCPDSRYFEEFKNEDGSTITIKLNDGILWDNKDTWHRSPFQKPIIDIAKNFSRSFINIRIIKCSPERKTPYTSPDLDFSQFQQKYLKYKSKYLELKKKLNKKF